MARDKAIQKLLERRKTAAIVPSKIIETLKKSHKGIIEELKAQKEYLHYLAGAEKVTNAAYKLSTARKRIAELKVSAVRLHFATREANLIQDFLHNPTGRPEDIAEAQQRISILGELAEELSPAEEYDKPEEIPATPTETTRTRINVDLSLVTRLAGSGIRVGPMHFRLIAGQLERTYMNMVRITTDKEDTKKFIRGVKKFFLPPGKTLESVGLDVRWLAARGFSQKEIDDFLD